MSAMTKKPECIFDGADNKKDLKEEDNLFSVVAAKNYGIMVQPVPSEPKLSYNLSRRMRETKHNDSRFFYILY